MAKKRGETHLMENASEIIIGKLLPEPWVIRKLHPDYGVDYTIEVFEPFGTSFPTMGEFLYVQAKSITSTEKKVVKVAPRMNVEKHTPLKDDEAELEVDVIKYQIDSDTIDNARLMGPATPLLLFLVDLALEEVFYVCLTDYYDKIIEPSGVRLDGQASVLINIPYANRLTKNDSADVMRFFACRAKLYGCISLANYQNREVEVLAEEIAAEHDVKRIILSLLILRRFSLRLRAMPLWERVTIWRLVGELKDILDEVIETLDETKLLEIATVIKSGFHEEAHIREKKHKAWIIVSRFSVAWKQFSGLGNVFEDLVREWLLPSYIGQLSSGDEDHYRSLTSEPQNPPDS
jgi:hypothetical protein